MKSIILSLLVLCAIISTCYGQKAYGVWDDENGVATVGTIDLSSAKAVGMFSNTGYVFNYGNKTVDNNGYNQEVIGISTYNPKNGLITYIATEISTGTKYIVTVDTNTMTIFNNSFVYSGMTIGNLAYDLTSNEYNLFGTFYTNDGNLYVIKLSVSSSIYKTIDTIPNVFPNATGTYIASTQHYGVCYQDTSFVLHCNYYDLSDSKVNSTVYSLDNLGDYWVGSSSPWAMTYLSTQNLVITYLNINNTSYQPNLYSYQMFWVTKNTFYNSGYATMNIRSSQISTYTPFCDASLPRVYQFAKTNFKNNPFGYSMFTYSTYNDQWVLTQPTNVGVINAWAIA